jgi:hypothetical protein
MYNNAIQLVTLSPKKLTAFRIDEELLAGLEVIWEREGIQPAEQVRRAIRTWLESKGLRVKAERKRASTRKRS